ncbi:hypothetical protein EYS14_05065 [Alteromonadaceae bacterium M269]|nr:hypothetical protein EYS14_05065 [Alteromonadaceae bacterium M269]
MDKLIIKAKRFALLGAAFLFVSNAEAGFINLDWRVEGDNQAVLHEETGKEWLKLNNTDSLSIEQVRDELGAGGLFEGWRLPTAEEVFVATSPFISTRFGNNLDESFSRTIATGTRGNGNRLYFAFENVFGRTQLNESQAANSRRNFFSRGLFVNDVEGSSLGPVLLSGLHFRIANRQADDRLTYHDNFDGGYTETFTNSTFGVFLVSDGGATLNSVAVDVPEPDTSGIAMLGFMGLLLVSRNRVFKPKLWKRNIK